MIKVPVAWGEMDSLGHVNNIVYFRYFESGRIACFKHIGVWEYLEKMKIGPILASTQCRFKIPLKYPDEVSIGTKIEDLSEDRFTMKYLVVSHEARKIAAEGEGLIVYYDYGAHQKTKIPEKVKERILNLGKFI